MHFNPLNLDTKKCEQTEEGSHEEQEIRPLFKLRNLDLLATGGRIFLLAFTLFLSF